MSVKANYILGQRKPRILFDMDDVLADFVGEIIRRFNIKTSQNRSVEECTSWYMENIFGQEIMNIIREDGLFEELNVKNDAVEVMQRLIKGGKYDIFIVTASTPEAYKEKMNWLKKFMPFFPQHRVIPCCEKSAIWGDLLIDDRLKNLYDYEKIGDCIVYDMPHNRKDNTFHRVYCLKDVEEYIENKLQNEKSA